MIFDCCIFYVGPFFYNLFILLIHSFRYRFDKFHLRSTWANETPIYIKMMRGGKFLFFSFVSNVDKPSPWLKAAVVDLYVVLYFINLCSEWCITSTPYFPSIGRSNETYKSWKKIMLCFSLLLILTSQACIIWFLFALEFSAPA